MRIQKKIQEKSAKQLLYVIILFRLICMSDIKKAHSPTMILEQGILCQFMEVKQVLGFVNTGKMHTG